MNNREKLKDKQRIIVKVGTSSLIHKATGNINLFRLEKLVRVLTEQRKRRDLGIFRSDRCRI